jgi:glycerol-3-phosphate O-acyltransferase
MARALTAKPRRGSFGSAAASPIVVLADVHTPVERGLVAEWAAVEHPGAERLEGDHAALAERLERGDDPLVVPVGVTWLPPERDGDRRVRAADLLALTNPHRPWSWAQPLIVRRDPARARVTAGEPAPVSDLRRRFGEQVGSVSGAAGFAPFVARQATLARERAERQLIGDRYKVPRLVAEQITASARFRERVGELADRLGRPVDDVLANATACLQEVAAVQSRLAIDVFRAVMGPLHKRAWTVDVDTAGLDRLRELNRNHALVFLPSHRSYADPLVLAQALDAHDFPRNHLLAGGNMSFWPIGPLGKRAGLIFIRRSFGDDQVYKLAVREYFGHLVAKRFNVEWYLEGGRTRTGKLRPPRFGLLRFLVEALHDDRADDVVLVPVSIVYDQLTEVGAMAAEQSGARKQAEGLRWLARYARAQRRNVGAVQVRFGQPLSLRGELDAAGEGAAQLEKVAFAVCDGINRATPVTATALATFALLGVRDRALTLDQVGRVIAPLLDYLERREIAGRLAALRRPAGLRRALDGLVEAGVVSCFAGGTEPVWSIAPGRHHVAAFYRNGALHHLVNRAVVELAILGVADSPGGGDPIEAAWEDALRMRDLLKFEFFFARKTRFRDELIVELELLDPGWRDQVGTPEAAAALLSRSRMIIAHRALRSFLDAQLVVAERLVARDSHSAVERDGFVAECLGVGRQMLLQGRLHGAESVSAELYAAALRLAANRDLVDQGRDDLGAAREAFLAEVEQVGTRLGRLGELELALLEEVLDGDRR